MTLFNAILLSLTLFSTGASQVHLSKDEALTLYLGDSVERKTLFLTDEQVRSIQSKAKAKIESKIVTYYVSQRGIAFFEKRTIRTMPATFIIVIDHRGAVQGVEMLAFFEPEDYLPPKRWMKTFANKTVDDDLWLKRGVYNISGATLSAQAITESVRKFLVTHDLVIKKDLP
jgi:hypothetical protein